LPSGLALDSSSGIISGTPIANSTSAITIQAADAKTSTSAQFFFLVWSKLIINPVSPASVPHIRFPSAVRAPRASPAGRSQPDNFRRA
jgi:hypothetical protein